MSFSLRHRRKRTSEPDLDVLLATASASQAVTLTARAQARVGERVRATASSERRIDLFAGRTVVGDEMPHAFAALDGDGEHGSST